MASLPFAGLTIPAASAVNAAAGSRSVAAAGAQTLVPLTYGEDRVRGQVLNIIRHASDATLVLVQVLWGHAFHQVDTLRLNDAALPGGSSVTSYTGSQVTADATLVAAFAAQGVTYTDTLAGYGYSVVALPVKAFDGRLDFTARVLGRRVYDPRKDSTAGGSGAHRLADPSTWEWSETPALALADWLASAVYGAGEAVLWSSVPGAADANDALVGSPAEARRKIGLTLYEPTPVSELSEALRAYAGSWLVPTAAGIKLLPDADASPSATYDHAAGQIAALDALQLRDLGQMPTVVEVLYTDTLQIPWRSASARQVLPGVGSTLPWRISTVRLPGIQRYSQAMREATERLNKLNLCNLSTNVDVFDVGIAHDKGDIVALTHPIGLSAKPFRVTDVQMPSPGRWRLAVAEHDPAVYSDAVVTTPTYPDTALTVPGAGVVWADVVGRPALFRVTSQGSTDAGAPVAAGLRNGETGASLYGAVRSYNLARIRRADGVVTLQQTYDVFGAGTNTAGRDAATLAADLNATDGNHIAVVWTWDEPQALRLSGGLPAAMYRCGASRGIFGSPEFKYRGAYVLVGIGGCGEGNGFEAYNGAIDGDTNAWCDVAFMLQNSQLIVTGTTAVPRTLADHGYSGDLDATNGATFGVNIAGQATTADIAADAVSELTSAFTAGNLSLPTQSTWYTGQSLTYTSSNAANDVALNGSFILNVSGGGTGAGTVEVWAVLSDQFASTQYQEKVFTLIGTSGTTISGTFAVALPEYVWQPSAVTRTGYYYLYWEKTGSYISATVSVQSRSMSARERKK